MSNRRSWSDVESESEPDNDSDSESDVKSENGLFVESEDRFESDDGTVSFQKYIVILLNLHILSHVSILL